MNAEIDPSIELAARVPLPPSQLSLASTALSQQGTRDEPAVHGSSDVHRTLGTHGTALAPVDGGLAAWSFLAGIFIVESIVWGFPVSSGVFLSAYLQEPKFADQKHASSVLPLIGPLASGIIYCSGVIITPLWSRHPRWRRPAAWLGTALCWASLFTASFAQQVTTLVILQGALYGVGAALVYFTCLSFVPEWFVERRGFANGVLFAGTALGGLVIPLVVPRLLQRFGVAITLRVLSLVILACLVPALQLVRPRLPESRTHGPAARSVNRKWLKSWNLWALMTINTVQGLAYFVPVIWIPTFANSLHVTGEKSALPLALLNGFSVIGRIATGVLADSYNPWAMALATFSITSAATFILWGLLSHDTTGLLVFAIVYGAIASGWSSQWSGFVKQISKDDPNVYNSIFGLLSLTRGLGNVLSTPISISLSRAHGQNSLRAHTGFGVAGGQYEKMIVYVGACFAGATVLTAVGWSASLKMSPHRR